MLGRADYIGPRPGCGPEGQLTICYGKLNRELQARESNTPLSPKETTTSFWTVHTKRARSQARKGTPALEACGRWTTLLGNTTSQATTPNRAKSLRLALAGTGSRRARASEFCPSGSAFLCRATPTVTAAGRGVTEDGRGELRLEGQMPAPSGRRTGGMHRYCAQTVTLPRDVGQKKVRSN